MKQVKRIGRLRIAIDAVSILWMRRKRCNYSKFNNQLGRKYFFHSFNHDAEHRRITNAPHISLYLDPKTQTLKIHPQF